MRGHRGPIMGSLPRVTLAVVNAALANAGHEERLDRGEGYFYFVGGSTATWYATSVDVFRVGALSVDRWLRERASLAAVRAGKMR